MPGPTALARRTLEKLQGDIQEAARELGKVKQEHTALTSDVDSLKREKTRLGDELRALRDDISKAAIEHGALQGLVEDARAAVAKAESAEADALGRIVECDQRRDKLIDELASLELSAKMSREEREGRVLLRERLEKEIKGLIGEKVETEHELQDVRDQVILARRKYDRILNAINEAVDNFRLFERRISQFSEETGYMVGYPKIEPLLEDNQ